MKIFGWRFWRGATRDDDNWLDSKDGHSGTALHAACNSGHDACARLLIASGANIHSRDSQGRTPMRAAAACLSQSVAHTACPLPAAAPSHCCRAAAPSHACSAVVVGEHPGMNGRLLTPPPCCVYLADCSRDDHSCVSRASLSSKRTNPSSQTCPSATT